MSEVLTLPERVPYHLAVIMDGNGRWAKARGLPRLAGTPGGRRKPAPHPDGLRRVWRSKF